MGFEAWLAQVRKETEPTLNGMGYQYKKGKTKGREEYNVVPLTQQAA